MSSKKNVSMIVSGAGWIASFADSLIKALRERGVSDEDIHSLVVEGGELPIGRIANALVGFVKSIFHITTGKYSATEEAVKAGNYDWADDRINSKNFPFRPRPVGQRTIVLLEMDGNPSSDEIKKEMQRRGFAQPAYEDALDFGVQYPDEQRDRTIVFLHEPWRDPMDNRDRVIALRNDGLKRDLGLYYSEPGDMWNTAGGHDLVFAGVARANVKVGD